MIHFIKTAVCISFLSAMTTAVSPAISQEKVDLDVINKIVDEGFHRSEVMDTLTYLSDEIGPRLTGGPAHKRANEWTAKKLTEWGLKNAHLEGFDFGVGWTPNHGYIHMKSPRNVQLYALPIAWHPGTNGPLEGEIYYAPMSSKKDFEKYKGKLAGKIVLVDTVRPFKEPDTTRPMRHNDETLAAREKMYIPKENGPRNEDSWINFVSFPYEREKFLASEGAIAMLRIARRDTMLLAMDNYQFRKDMLPKTPAMEMIPAHYNQLVRLQQKGQAVTVNMDIDVTYHKDDMQSYNTLADIPGQGRNPEIVMVGGHLDSWANGTGTTDNGAGVAVAMEAVRILKAIGIKPKRTIRIGLWGGEEQGYFGSQQYVTDHLATRPLNKDEKLKYMGPYEWTSNQFPITFKKEFERFSVYFNLDNGTGKIRGIYAQNNMAALPIFEKWLKPFHGLGAETVSPGKTGGTDHEVFDVIGLPGFQFIQDPLDYDSHTHHTQLDTLDRARAQDLKQAAVIVASFVYNAAMREERFPRKPMPHPYIGSKTDKDHK